MGTSPADRHAELQQLSYLLKDSLHWQYILTKKAINKMNSKQCHQEVQPDALLIQQD